MKTVEYLNYSGIFCYGYYFEKPFYKVVTCKKQEFKLRTGIDQVRKYIFFKHLINVHSYFKFYCILSLHEIRFKHGKTKANTEYISKYTYVYYINTFIKDKCFIFFFIKHKIIVKKNNLMIIVHILIEDFFNFKVQILIHKFWISSENKET